MLRVRDTLVTQLSAPSTIRVGCRGRAGRPRRAARTMDAQRAGSSAWPHHPQSQSSNPVWIASAHLKLFSNMADSNRVFPPPPPVLTGHKHQCLGIGSPLA